NSVPIRSHETGGAKVASAAPSDDARLMRLRRMHNIEQGLLDPPPTVQALTSFQKRGCVRGTATQLVRPYAPLFISYPAWMSARVCGGAARPCPEPAQYHAAAALSNYQRPPDRLLLRRRTLHCG